MKITPFNNRLNNSPLGPAVILLACLLTPYILAAEQQVTFGTPSGNIECIYTPAGGTPVYGPVDGGPELSCDRVLPRYVRVILGPAGPATLLNDVGDAGAGGNPNKLEYGNSWSQGPFTCTSTREGLSCSRTGKPAHGFFMSRSGIKTY
jgi:hypothetical protein